VAQLDAGLRDRNPENDNQKAHGQGYLTLERVPRQQITSSKLEIQERVESLAEHDDQR
jgi:hypothetical protein